MAVVGGEVIVRRSADQDHCFRVEALCLANRGIVDGVRRVSMHDAFQSDG